MSATLVCDRCHQPKVSTRHYGLRYNVPAKGGWTNGSSARTRGSIDLCDDCIAVTTHDGRGSGHQVGTPKTRRIEFGRVTR